MRERLERALAIHREVGNRSFEAGTVAYLGIAVAASAGPDSELGRKLTRLRGMVARPSGPITAADLEES